MRVPKYMALAESLREKILLGEYASGERIQSDNALMTQTGLSRQTVRQAIAQLQQDGLVQRIHGSGTYVTNAAKREPTYNIAVVTTYIGEYIFPDILRGIHQVLTCNGYTPMLFATHNRVDNERRILQELLCKPIDGLIVEGTKTSLPNPNIDLYKQLEKHAIPVVFVNGCYGDLKDATYVVLDDRAGGSAVCEYLLNRGHTKIAGIFKGDDMQGHNRYAGYAQALLSHGCPLDDCNVLWFTTENREQILSAAMDQICSCTAVVCYNDEVAINLAMQIRDGKSTVKPELASFDHSTYAQLSPVPFFSLESPKEKIGREVAGTLLELLHRGRSDSVILPWA